MENKLFLKNIEATLSHLDYQQRVMTPPSSYEQALAEERGIQLPEMPPIYDMDEIYNEQQDLYRMLETYSSKQR